MSQKVTIGGERVGSGNKMKVHLHGYERSTHDLSYLFRTTMAAGTLVPFLVEVALPGDTFDIDLNASILTHPTIGPLFGSFKVQLDVFQAPVRLYQAALHNNALKVGMNMANVYLPQINIDARPLNYEIDDLDNQQINPSSLLAYLNIRGLGHQPIDPPEFLQRQFNAIPFLAYWDIYKNYYSNKQEEIGAVIHGASQASWPIPEMVDNNVVASPSTVTINKIGTGSPAAYLFKENSIMTFTVSAPYTEPTIESYALITSNGRYRINQIFATWYWDASNHKFQVLDYIPGDWGTLMFWDLAKPTDQEATTPEVWTFPLENLDEMRENILQAPTNTPFLVKVDTSPEPYNLILAGSAQTKYATLSQEGLGLKTYQSDLFNNWIQTEWIDGTNGISEVTSIDTSGGSFTIDTLNLSKKVYDMLNRIAISGGTYDDWQRVTYDHEAFTRAETPMYMGGLSKELVFQEVISNSQSTGDSGEQPLGTLGGRGVLGKKHKGGKVTIKVNEISYIMGIISLTPRIDYSQGNKWDVNLKTMDDFHKPALDEIGFQDLITDQMAWWDTTTVPGGTWGTSFNSAGKQPAWLNYMTNVNIVRGNFAIESNEMFMVLNRRYEWELEDDLPKIKDLTTYIDPMKFNHIFAQTSRDAQNFWTQISVDMTVRRKMSAKLMPNL